MAQKTVTINGKKYTGKQIADLMDKSNITHTPNQSNGLLCDGK